MSDLTPALLSNVGDDVLHLFEKGKPNAEKVAVDLLNYSKREVSRATGVPVTSIRYDYRIPHELEERLFEWAAALNLVATFFGGDLDKTLIWFRTPNSLLGYISPRDLIKMGRAKKLLKLIQQALDENVRR